MTTQQTLDTNLTTFGARLRHEREEQGLSRPELSKLTGRTLTSRVIDHLESGHTEATLSRAEVLADALGVEKLWLLFGERPGAASGNDNDRPDEKPENRKDAPDTEPGEEPENNPVEAPKAGNSGETGSEKPVTTGGDRSVSVNNDANEDEPEDDAARQYVHQMFDLLETVDDFRKDGFLKHQRKMPHLLAQLEATAKYLEVDELTDIAFERDVEIEEGDADNLVKLTDADIDELVARIIDTAVLGTDLYDVDFDVLKAFARKNGIEQPLFSGWKGYGHLVPLVRAQYREKAFAEALKQSKSLALAG